MHDHEACIGGILSATMSDDGGVVVCSNEIDSIGHDSGGNIELGGMRRGFTGREGS